MNESFRRIAVSGSAAVALLGGVATLAAVSAEPASATEIQAAVDRATGAPVTLPDGRTMHVPGLDNAGYQADVGHYTAAVTLASAKTDTTNGLTPDNGSGHALQTPFNTGQVPAGYGQQIQTQASGGAVLGTGIVALLLLGIIVFFKIKHGSIKVGDAILVAFLGVALSGTVLGVMAKSMTETGIGSLGGVLGGL